MESTQPIAAVWWKRSLYWPVATHCQSKVKTWRVIEDVHQSINAFCISRLKAAAAAAANICRCWTPQHAWKVVGSRHQTEPDIEYTYPVVDVIKSGGQSVNTLRPLDDFFLLSLMSMEDGGPIYAATAVESPTVVEQLWAIISSQQQIGRGHQQPSMSRT